jgi:hypothetical protein
MMSDRSQDEMIVVLGTSSVLVAIVVVVLTSAYLIRRTRRAAEAQPVPYNVKPPARLSDTYDWSEDEVEEEREVSASPWTDHGKAFLT